MPQRVALAEQPLLRKGFVQVLPDTIGIWLQTGMDVWLGIGNHGGLPQSVALICDDIQMNRLKNT